MAEITETQLISIMIRKYGPMTLPDIVGEEIACFLGSDRLMHMQEAEAYYLNRSDVQRKTNEIAKRSNTKIEHSVLKKLIDQKINYTLSRPFSISSANPAYSDALNKLFNDIVRQKVKRFGRGAPRAGIGWMIPYFDEDGVMNFRVAPATNLIPFWADTEHTILNGFLYFYTATEYEARTPYTITRAELWDTNGVMYFKGKLGRFQEDPDKPGRHPHFTLGGVPYFWKTPPLLWCKYNDEELPLQYFIKDLIDDLNWQTSITSDVLRDVAKFIWVIRNYGGEDLAEFVDDLRKYLAIKVDSDGEVTTIQPDLKVDSILNFIDKQRRDSFDLGAGVDTKDPELGSASGKAIYFRYMDLDTDSANLQSELKAAFLRLKPFIDDYFLMTGQGEFHQDEFQIIFNTDMPVDETEIFQNAQTAQNLGISKHTIFSNIPWIEDVNEEFKRIQAEKEAARQEQEEELRRMSGLSFPSSLPDPPEDLPSEDDG